MALFRNNSGHFLVSKYIICKEHEFCLDQNHNKISSEKATYFVAFVIEFQVKLQIYLRLLKIYLKFIRLVSYFFLFTKQRSGEFVLLQDLRSSNSVSPYVNISVCLSTGISQCLFRINQYLLLKMDFRQKF